jgi:hypothetical protein
MKGVKRWTVKEIENLTDKDIETIKSTQEFLKEAFCLDGGCEFIREVPKGLTAGSFQLTDSKRGTFFITIHQEDVK